MNQLDQLEPLQGMNKPFIVSNLYEQSPVKLPYGQSLLYNKI